MDRNQSYLRPKAYLSSLLSLQTYRFYPDIYAILLNDIHLVLSPKTPSEEHKIYIQLFNEVLKNIPHDLDEKLVKVTNEFSKEHKNSLDQGVRAMFQGSIDEVYRSKCNRINFLLWTE